MSTPTKVAIGAAAAGLLAATAASLAKTKTGKRLAERAREAGRNIGRQASDVGRTLTREASRRLGYEVEDRTASGSANRAGSLGRSRRSHGIRTGATGGSLGGPVSPSNIGRSASRSRSARLD